MKKTLQLVAVLFFALLGTQNGIAQNSVSVNGGATWLGYANVFLTDGSTFQFGSAWGVADLKSVVNVGANTVTLYPNFNTYNAADPYWSNGAVGNKVFEANTFVENNALAGQVLTFSGNVTSNTLNSAYTAVAFIKGLNPATGYSTDVFVSAPLVAGQPFSITTDAAIPAGLVVQYGFTVKGLNANPAQEAALGNVVVASNVVVPTEPMTAAPTPTRPANTVISMFSDAYTNVPVDTWRTVWSNATLTDLQIAGNPTKKYSALDFVGIETVNNQINATPMQFFHIDAWTPNMTTFRVKLVDFGANGVYQGVPNDDVEFELSYTPVLSQWNSYDIPLSAFTGLTSRAHIAQLILSGNPPAAGIVFVDNVYFSSTPLAATSFNMAEVKMYPNPASDIVTITAVNPIDSVSIYSVLGQEIKQLQFNTNAVSVDIADLQAGMYVVKVTSSGVTATSRLVKK